ncbi:hypothetical protein L9F63_001969, partial [Diploptera punctata]
NRFPFRGLALISIPIRESLTSESKDPRRVGTVMISIPGRDGDGSGLSLIRESLTSESKDSRRIGNKLAQFVNELSLKICVNQIK